MDSRDLAELVRKIEKVTDELQVIKKIIKNELCNPVRNYREFQNEIDEMCDR